MEAAFQQRVMAAVPDKTGIELRKDFTKFLEKASMSIGAVGAGTSDVSKGDANMDRVWNIWKQAQHHSCRVLLKNRQTSYSRRYDICVERSSKGEYREQTNQQSFSEEYLLFDKENSDDAICSCEGFSNITYASVTDALSEKTSKLSSSIDIVYGLECSSCLHSLYAHLPPSTPLSSSGNGDKVKNVGSLHRVISEGQTLLSSDVLRPVAVREFKDVDMACLSILIGSDGSTSRKSQRIVFTTSGIRICAWSLSASNDSACESIGNIKECLTVDEPICSWDLSDYIDEAVSESFPVDGRTSTLPFSLLEARRRDATSTGSSRCCSMATLTTAGHTDTAIPWTRLAVTFRHGSVLAVCDVKFRCACGIAIPSSVPSITVMAWLPEHIDILATGHTDGYVRFWNIPEVLSDSQGENSKLPISPKSKQYSRSVRKKCSAMSRDNDNEYKKMPTLEQCLEIDNDDIEDGCDGDWKPPNLKKAHPTTVLKESICNPSSVVTPILVASMSCNSGSSSERGVTNISFSASCELCVSANNVVQFFSVSVIRSKIPNTAVDIDSVISADLQFPTLDIISLKKSIHHMGDMRAISWDPKGSMAVCGGDDDTVHIFGPAHSQSFQTPRAGKRAQSKKKKYPIHGMQAITNFFQMRPLNDGRFARELPLLPRQHSSFITATVVWRPSNGCGTSTVISSGRDGRIVIYSNFSHDSNLESTEPTCVLMTQLFPTTLALDSNSYLWILSRKPNNTWAIVVL